MQWFSGASAWVRRNMRSERGAALAEGAIVAPFFFLMVFALIDGGLYFAGHTSLTNATRTGARAASAAGADSLADFDVLNAVERSVAGVPDGRIDRVVVFRAADWDDEPLESCKNGIPVSNGSIGDCNVYVQDDFDRAATDFGVGKWSKDDAWPGWLRNDRRSDPGPDFVGVWVQADCLCVTGLFGSQKLTNTTVMRIEAKQA